MLQPFHVTITKRALENEFSSAALEQIIAANVRQDGLRGQVGHPEYHFDDNAFEQSYAYIAEQRARVVTSLQANDAGAARAAFGRLIHTAQDFYAHSNYIQLWLACRPEEAASLPSEVEPLDADLIASPALRSGRVYVLEVLTLIPPFRSLAMSMLPRDSHAWMNMDAPGRGPAFEYAFQAAVKRTLIEFKHTTTDMPENLLRLFAGR